MLAEQLCHRTGRFDRERRVPSHECPHLCAIFFLQHRAGNVGYPAFRLEQGYSPIEHLRLLLLTLLERARPHSPFGVRVAPPSSGARAWGVDKNEVHASRQIVNFSTNGFWRAHLNVSRSRALEAIMDRSESAPVQRSTTCSPGLAPENIAANCDASSWISTIPLINAGSA